MTKSDLINALKEEFHITRPEVTLIVNLFFDEMSNALANGDRVELRGSGSFSVKNLPVSNKARNDLIIVFSVDTPQIFYY